VKVNTLNLTFATETFHESSWNHEFFWGQGHTFARAGLGALDFCQLVHIQPKDFDGIDEIGAVVLFILRVSHVIAGSDRQEQHVHSRGILKSRCNGNRSTLSCVVWQLSVDLLGSSSSSVVVGVFWIRQPRLGTMNHGDCHFVGRTQLFEFLLQMSIFTSSISKISS